VGFYAIENLEQGSTEWLEWRRGVIGASDAPTIMGENPWSSANHLMKDKLGLNPPFHGNAATRDGQYHESFARKALIKEAKFNLIPLVVQDDKVPYFAASLDAVSEDFQHLFEIKCGVKSYQYVAENKRVPKYYYGQLQHMLMVLDLSVIYLTVYRPDQKMLTMQVPFDFQYVKTLKAKEEDFAKALTARGHKMQKTFKGKLVTQ
jgi:putative phage-type endonuclease